MLNTKVNDLRESTKEIRRSKQETADGWDKMCLELQQMSTESCKFYAKGLLLDMAKEKCQGCFQLILGATIYAVVIDIVGR